MTTLQDCLRMFAGLRVNKGPDGISPHKPCLLLAVLDLVESCAIVDRRVRYTPILREVFSGYFSVVAKHGDHDRPYFPFYYLKSESFWTLKADEGRRREFARIKSPSHRQVEDLVEYAEIDAAVFGYMQDPVSREALREALITRWFPDVGNQAALRARVARHRQSNAYERTLRGKFDDVPMVRDEPLPREVRDPAFRRLVLEAYDYRCAASGWRVILPEGGILVEAAHLIPHAESYDDDPRNGIALTPSFHWALDKHIIAPGPDMKWHVSKAIDDRIADNRPLIDLEGQPVILPRRRSQHPRQDALTWRLEKLLGTEG